MTKTRKAIDASTEEKIKNAAHVVFRKKGYVAARTRDIAEEAGINLALLNYYFRSKEKLFELIMSETLTAFSLGLRDVLNDERTTFEEKIERLVDNYLDMFTKEPEIPLFVLNELRNRPEDLLAKLPVIYLFQNSVFVTQFQERAAAGRMREPNLLHFMMNLLGVTIFPFIGQSLIMVLGGLDESQFNRLIQERKKRIPVWIKAIMEAE
ncbi:MAG: TetR/AcrR family transcriptional regulator [Tannerella sp.]|jgi:AcrR family transcriptional regulator|nr:TetR/AcrR family transcriptional regulator [Tannerella sp.]